MGLAHTSMFLTTSQLPLFRALHGLMPCQSLYARYSQVQETKQEAERATGQRGGEEVVREAFLKVAIFESEL